MLKLIKNLKNDIEFEFSNPKYLKNKFSQNYIQ